MNIWSDPEKKTTKENGVSYRPELTPYLLKDAGEARGAVIVLPGGGYSSLAPHEGRPIAEAFNQQGFHAFVLTYRTNPSFWPAPQEDVLRAIKIVRANAGKWGVKENAIAVCGFSAGGHLAGSSGIVFDRVKADNQDECDGVSARPDALILCYPVISLCSDYAHVSSGDMLFGASQDIKMRRLYNLDEQVRPDTPPAFLWHTADDGCVPVQNSLAFARSMWAKKLCAELHVFPHGTHGLGLAPDMPDIRVWPELAAEFLRVSCRF